MFAKNQICSSGFEGKSPTLSGGFEGKSPTLSSGFAVDSRENHQL